MWNSTRTFFTPSHLNTRLALFALLLMGVPTVASAQTPEPPADAPRPTVAKPRKRFSLLVGPEYGQFRPGSSKTRQRFGSNWQGGVGLGFGSLEAIKPGLIFNTDTSFFYGRRGSNRAYVVTLNAGPRYGVRVGGGTTGYIGLNVGYTGLNLRSDPDAVKAGWRFAPSASGLAGINFGRRTYIEAHYYGIQRTNGLDFSGINLLVGTRFKF